MRNERLRVFENRVLRRVIWSRQQGNGEDYIKRSFMLYHSFIHQ
jgi:hypothetical protein